MYKHLKNRVPCTSFHVKIPETFTCLNTTPDQCVLNVISFKIFIFSNVPCFSDIPIRSDIF